MEQAAVLPAVSCLAADAGTDFYAWNGQLPANNGEVIKCQALGSLPDADVRGYRVMYRTTVQVRTGNLGATKTDVAVPATGVVWIPEGELADKDAGTRPVIANTHGAVGILADCGPSKSTYYDKSFVNQIAAVMPAKPVVVVPDYVGLGVDHKVRVIEKDFALYWPDLGRPVSYPFSDITHPFVSLVGEGRATVDIVRAARQLPNSKLTAGAVKWVAFGQSQGGHAGLGAAEVMADGYASKTELPLLGVVVGAPATEISKNTNWTNELRNSVQAMVAASLPLEWRDLRASNYLTEPGLRWVVGNTANKVCFNQASPVDLLVSAVLPLFKSERDPFTDPQASAALRSLDPGHTSNEVAPIFVGQVRGDPLIWYQRTRDFVAGANATYRNKLTLCEYYGGSARTAQDQTNYEKKDFLSRADDHNAFKKMFAGADARIVCTNYRPNDPAKPKTPTEVAKTPIEFVRSLFLK